MARRLEGIFSVLLTPFHEDLTLDVESLQSEVDFVIEAGTHGIVTPVNTSEFFLLSDDERRQLTDIVMSQVAGRVPVVIGTAAPDAGTAEMLTRYAREAGAAGVIAMPPYVVHQNASGLLDYYGRIGNAADGLPIVLQNTSAEVGAPMGLEMIVNLADEVPALQYVKEETLPSTHRITELLRVAEGRLQGVFGGSGGRVLVDELKRGACGLMSGCHLVDAQVKVYNLLRSGHEDEARAAFVRQLPAQNLWAILGLGVAKEILRRRGIFRTNVCRKPVARIDQADHVELDYALALVRQDLAVKESDGTRGTADATGF